MKIMRIANGGIQEKLSDPRGYAFFMRLVGAGYIEWRPAFREWMEKSGGWSYNLLGYVNREGTITPNYAYVLKLFAKIDLSSRTYQNLVIELSSAGKILATWNTTSDDFIKSKNFDVFLDQKAKASGIIMIHEHMEEIELQKKIMESREIARREALNMKIRLTRRSYEMSEARAIEAIVRPKEEGGHEIGYEVFYLESSKHEPFKIWKDSNPDGTALTKAQAMELFNEFVISLKSVRFVADGAHDYIPENVNKSNWNFAWNKPINSTEEIISEPKKDSMGTEKNPSFDLNNILGKSGRMVKKGQNFNFEGFFSGEVPDYAVNYLGTSGVEASQIKSMFGRAGDAIDLVNQFNSSLLLNISFIFNFGKGGAYGVYLSELDRAIKTKALQKKLEQKGYKIEVTEKGLTAFPKEGQNITSEQVQQDIDSIYQDLQSKGGTAIGVNVGAVLSASKSDAMESGSKDPEIWEWMAVLHLGGTIIHEAVHAKGSRDEATPESAEAAFSQWALPKVNEKYKESLKSKGKEEEYLPLIITPNKRHAAKQSWYKQAQMSYYIPEVYRAKPLGSDLKGRFPYDPQIDEGMADWSKIAQYYQNLPLEARLGRQFMSPLPRDLDQAHDHIEEQLRKYTREDQKLDTSATIEELLSEGHDKNRGYLTLEELLDEKRPHPLIIPLKKNASMSKSAGLKLNLTPFMVEEISIDFENYDEHYDENPDDPQKQVEKNIYEKLTSGNFDFNDEELKMIGSTLNSIETKDIFAEDLKARKQLFNVELQLGIWKPITEERAKEAVRNGINVRMSNFPKVNGVRYEYNYNWENSFGTVPPAPIPIPITKGITLANCISNRVTKTATLFGWMNNLDLDDGSTIPGLSDRVMAWDDRDESFSQEEEWIRKQPRYNPEYDLKGFYYRWIEPRFRPQLFDDMTQDYSNTHPAKRFACSDPVHGEWSQILAILDKAKNGVLTKKLSTRFVISEDLMPIMDYMFGKDNIKLHVFEIKDSPENEKLFSVWVTGPDIEEDKVERSEKYIQKVEVSEEAGSALEELLGRATDKIAIADEIIKQADVISEEYNFQDVRLKDRDDGHIYYEGGKENHAFIVGEILADKLHIDDLRVDSRKMSLAFHYNGISALFKNA